MNNQLFYGKGNFKLFYAITLFILSFDQSVLGGIQFTTFYIHIFETFFDLQRIGLKLRGKYLKMYILLLSSFFLIRPLGCYSRCPFSRTSSLASEIRNVNRARFKRQCSKFSTSCVYFSIIDSIFSLDLQLTVNLVGKVFIMGGDTYNPTQSSSGLLNAQSGSNDPTYFLYIFAAV